MESAPRAYESGQRVLVGLASLVVVAAGLRAAAPILEPVAFAIFLGVLALPLFRWLRARGLAVPLAVAAAMLSIAGVLTIFLLLLLGALGEFREVGPHYWAVLNERARYTLEWWEGKGIALLDYLPDQWRDPKTIVTLASGTLRGVLHFLSAGAITLLALVFLLVEFAAFPGKLAAAPGAVRERMRFFADVSSELQRYLLIKTAISLAVGLAAGLWVAFLGVDFAVLLGLVAFSCHFIPNVGAALAAAPAMLCAFVQYDLPKALIVGIGYLVIGVALGNLAEPALMGRRLGMSPLIVFLSLVFWGWLWGPVGMFLSVPLTMSVKILLSSSPQYRWIAALLDAERREEIVPATAEPATAGPEPS
ncbi:MAG: AI-2E family transporter [Thermoanaerobaculia bacterium]